MLAQGRPLYSRKHCLDKAVNVGSIPTAPTISGVSTMDSTMSFYLMNVGSIPARRTKF